MRQQKEYDRGCGFAPDKMCQSSASVKAATMGTFLPEQKQLQHELRAKGVRGCRDAETEEIKGRSRTMRRNSIVAIKYSVAGPVRFS